MRFGRAVLFDDYGWSFISDQSRLTGTLGSWLEWVNASIDYRCAFQWWIRRARGRIDRAAPRRAAAVNTHLIRDNGAIHHVDFRFFFKSRGACVAPPIFHKCCMHADISIAITEAPCILQRRASNIVYYQRRLIPMKYRDTRVVSIASWYKRITLREET